MDSAPAHDPATGSGYTPVQQRVIDLLGKQSSTRSAPSDLVAALRSELEERCAPLAELVPEGATLWVGKSQLHQLDGCEARWQAERRSAFRWSVAAAQGTVAHRAIELAVHARGHREPAHLVDDAMVSLADGDDAMATFLRTLTNVEDAELRQRAVGFVTAFEECFPPLRPQWRPVVEGRATVRLAGGRIVLSARPDLTLGRPGDGGKVIIDLKTGVMRRHHVDDLRFYALVEACRIGVAPRQVATLYLDSGTPAAEVVTAGVLEAATERVVRAVEAMVEIRSGARPARARAQAGCRFCPALGECETGAAFLAADDEHEDFFWNPRAALPV